MKTTIPYLRVIVFMIISFFLLEFLVESGDKLAILEYPIIWAVLAMLLVVAIALEIILAAIQRVLYTGLSLEAKEHLVKKENNFSEWILTTYKKLMDAKPMDQEQEIVLDHSYDGIRELDNTLPPWWKYLFILTIIWAFAYMIYYHVYDGTNQYQEYEIEVAQAKSQIEEYKKNNKDLIDANSVEIMTAASDIDAGKAIYMENCVACHKADGGGGIGPNLTDDNWILGGGIKNIFHTISEGGRAGKGMVAWKSELNPKKIAQVSSFIMTLHGTNPADAKEAEGDIWNPADADSGIETITE